MNVHVVEIDPHADRKVPTLYDVVEEAAVAALGSRQHVTNPYDWSPGEDGPTDVDAWIVHGADLSEVTNRGAWSVPALAVEVVGSENRSGPIVAPYGMDKVTVDLSDRSGSVAVVAEWLEANVGSKVTDHEREQIEVVVAEIRRRLLDGAYDDQNPIEVAQTQAAIDTADAQLRAPHPSRRVLSWVFSQIPGFVAGSLQSVAGNYLTELIDVFT